MPSEIAGSPPAGAACAALVRVSAADRVIRITTALAVAAVAAVAAVRSYRHAYELGAPTARTG